jgi:hypothetical protein
MFTLRVACKCGFLSKEALWGPPGIFDQDRAGMPVYLPTSGKLLTHWFYSDNPNSSPEERDAWIAEHGRPIIIARYGKDAVAVTAADTDNGMTLFCPKCRRFDARVEVTGMH